MKTDIGQLYVESYRKEIKVLEAQRWIFFIMGLCLGGAVGAFYVSFYP